MKCFIHSFNEKITEGRADRIARTVRALALKRGVLFERSRYILDQLSHMNMQTLSSTLTCRRSYVLWNIFVLLSSNYLTITIFLICFPTKHVGSVTLLSRRHIVALHKFCIINKFKCKVTGSTLFIKRNVRGIRVNIFLYLPHLSVTFFSIYSTKLDRFLSDIRPPLELFSGNDFLRIVC